ncbi:MAG: ATP-binding protein [bacterium]
MKFIQRVLAKTLLKAIKTFPAITLTGPRQSGKTTLVKMLFANTHTYVSLEDPDIRLRVKEDPLGFLSQYKPPLILDEIQYVPELLSYIKTRIDENRKPGQWLLTGSQNFTLMHNITQSLAGRTAILELMPFAMSERVNNADNALDISRWLKKLNEPNLVKKKLSLSEIMLRGSYPEIAFHKKVDRKLWCSSYITTYLERDIRNLSAIGDLSQFERFLIACAVRTGQILNISEIARDIGISVPTAKRWLSLLETGRQIYLLYPYYKNIGKRLVKSPKIYITDPGLGTYLLGLDEPRTLFNSPYFGNLFETIIVCDFVKRFLNNGDKPSMYYLRSRDGLEIDLVIEHSGKLHLFEIKSSMTIVPRHCASLIRLKRDLKNMVATAAIISATEENFYLTEGIFNYAWQNVLVR